MLPSTLLPAADAFGRLTRTDINNPVTSQVTAEADGSFTVIAGGNDTWGNEDSFTFLHEDRTNDFDVAVQVLRLDVEDPGQQDSAKAALMARSSLLSGSPNVQINALPDESKNTFESIYRPVADQGTDDFPDRPASNTRGETPYPDVWLRLKREGSRFTTMYGNDPYSWTVLSSVLTDPAEFPEALKVGLSTVAHVGPSEDQALRVTASYAGYRDVPAVPPTSVTGEPAGDRAPGMLPRSTVTAVNWKIEVPADGLNSQGEPFLYNTGTRDEILVFVEGNGPIPWTAPGFNQGDLDINIGARDPLAGLSNTGVYGPDYNRAVVDPAMGPVQAWYPTLEKGMLLGTVRANRAEWNDGSPAFHGICWVTTEGSSRRGYSMLDGVFRAQDIYFSMGKLGERAEFLPEAASPQALREGNIDAALAWFPFEQGWIGGYFANADIDPAAWYRHATYGPALGQLISDKNSAAAILTWEEVPQGGKGGLATLALPGVNSLTDGMVFANSNHEGNGNRGAVVTVAPKSDGSGWVVAIRPDDEDVSPESYAASNQSQFGFVYLPFDAVRLVGGRVTGGTGAVAASAGTFTVTRLAAGRYALELPGKTGMDGMLLLQNAGYHPTVAGVADDAALSYEYVDNRFIVEARTVSNSGAFDTFPLRDADYCFAWVDFVEPLAPAGADSVGEPTFEIAGPVTVTPESMAAREAGVAASTARAEALVVTIDNANTLGLVDPVTSEALLGVVLGYYYHPTTLEIIGEPFVILGNPQGGFSRNSVAYNPVTDQYVVTSTARPFGANNLNIPMVAFVNSSTATTRVAKKVVHDQETLADYDDIALAVSTKNGHTLVVAEYQFGDINPGEGEGVVGWMYDTGGNLLGETWTRLDVVQSNGDEDDPDVVYLPQQDRFFFVTNTDAPEETALKNRIIGFAVETAVDGAGKLVLGQVGLLDTQRLEGLPQGHPSALENPFNGEVVVAFDYGNGQANGDLSFHRMGSAPGYVLTQARPQVPYSEGDGASPLAHRHPRMAADLQRGVMVVSHNRRDSTDGLSNAMVFALLDSEGQPLPGRPLGQYVLAEGVDGDPVPSDANVHDVVFDATSGAFLVVYNENNVRTRLARLRVTSNHLETDDSVRLSARLVSGGIEIRWPTSAAGAVLQTTQSVAGTWGAVAGTVQVEGDQNVLVVPVTGSAALYRLRL